MVENTVYDTNTSIVRVLSYGRVSKYSQLTKRYEVNGQRIGGKSGSVEQQPETWHEYIHRYDNACPKCGKRIKLVTASEFFDEGQSGTTADRDGVEFMLDLASKNEIDLVLTVEGDRLGRNKYENQWIRNELIKLGVQTGAVHQPKFVYCPECYNPYDDDAGVLQDSISDVKSHLDLSRIRRNYVVGMKKRVSNGLPTGSLGYGLIKARDEIKNGMRIQDYDWDMKKVLIVERIVHEYMEKGLGMWKISQQLNQENIPSPQGKQWGRTAIKHILQNPIYSGCTRHGWKISKGFGNRKTRVIQPFEKWILKKDSVLYNKRRWEFDRYLEIMKEIERRKTMGARASGSDALLIGLLKCTHCGYNMFQAKSRRTLGNGEKYEWYGYACGTFMHRGACQHNGKKQSVVDDLVVKEILKIADHETSKNSYLKQLSKNHTEKTKELLAFKEKSLSELYARLERAKEGFLTRALSNEECIAEQKSILPRISSLVQEISKLRTEIDNPGKNQILDFNEVIDRLKIEYKNNNKKQIQILLRRIIDRVELQANPIRVKIFFKVS